MNSTEFSIEVKSIELKNSERGALPAKAIINLDINGMPDTLYPQVRPERSTGDLVLYPRDPYDICHSWGGYDAWTFDVMPALEKHMSTEWRGREIRDVTDAVNNAVYTAVNAKLQECVWEDEYELDSDVQRRAAEILNRAQENTYKCELIFDAGAKDTWIGMRRGYVVIEQEGLIQERIPLTVPLARLIIEVDAGRGGIYTEDELGELSDAILWF